MRTRVNGWIQPDQDSNRSSADSTSHSDGIGECTCLIGRFNGDPTEWIAARCCVDCCIKLTLTLTNPFERNARIWYPCFARRGDLPDGYTVRTPSALRKELDNSRERISLQ
jgi:hypothetical protein